MSDDEVEVTKYKKEVSEVIKGLKKTDGKTIRYTRNGKYSANTKDIPFRSPYCFICKSHRCMDAIPRKNLKHKEKQVFKAIAKETDLHSV